jgi:hypothetical protein
MIYFQHESGDEVGIGEPCPCCGIDLEENHTCKWPNESHWDQIANAQRQTPSLYDAMIL